MESYFNKYAKLSAGTRSLIATTSISLPNNPLSTIARNTKRPIRPNPLIPIFVEGKEIYGPWGAKSLGEPTLELTAVAISNAVSNALGKRFFNLPLNLEEILLGKKLRPAEVKRGSLQ